MEVKDILFAVLGLMALASVSIAMLDINQNIANVSGWFYLIIGFMIISVLSKFK
ncbi:MAG: hypothetical protein RXR08_14315 [Sulfolobaceae archaeon]